jgi:hypothetical protein
MPAIHVVYDGSFNLGRARKERSVTPLQMIRYVVKRYDKPS